MQQTRQLAAIMFTDIAGYTAMMGKDEVAALELLHKARSVQKDRVSAHHGEWLKEMGDGVLAKFNSARDAVLCASEIQEQCRHLEGKIRIGIHLGDVTIEDADVFGDGVNIASRLQSAADPGGIYISESVYRAIRSISKIHSVYLGKLKLKNVADPVPAYAVRGNGLPEPSTGHIRKLNASDQVQSLAVLPFRSLSADPQQQYFVDGMQDALIGELSHIKAVRVISRTSTMRYRDSMKTVPEIATELGVEAIVEATVLKSDNNLRVQTQLIKAFPEEEHLWSSSYDKEIKDVLSLYSELVEDITTQIGARLTVNEAGHLEEQSHEVNPKAYEAYLKGIFYWEKLTPTDLETSLKYFEQACSLDSQFAPAYSGIAGAWLGRMQMGLVPPEEAVPRIKRAVSIALKLDINMADPHFWGAIISVWVDWDWKKGRSAFENALEINPNYALAAAYFSHLLVILQKPGTALVYMETALDLDPFNSLIKALYGMVLNYTRNYSKSIDVLSDILGEERTHPVALSALRSVYHNQGDYEMAYEIFKRSYEEKHDDVAVSTLKQGYKKGGYHKALERTAELMISRSEKRYDTPWQVATLYTRAGINDKALSYLEKAFEIRDPNMPYIGVDPIFDEIRQEQRFHDLLSKMNLQSKKI